MKDYRFSFIFWQAFISFICYSTVFSSRLMWIPFARGRQVTTGCESAAGLGRAPTWSGRDRLQILPRAGLHHQRLGRW